MHKPLQRLSVVILGKNEEQTISDCLRQITEQELFDRQMLTAEILVVANGCTDRTADQARLCAADLTRPNLEFRIFDLPQGGKSRSWNHAVHEFADPAAGAFLFIDSDIRLADKCVFDRLVDDFIENDAVAAYSGYPIKSIAQKKRLSLLDRFSLIVSKNTRHMNAICGSLYIIQSDVARTIWLPDETPGEDGFLNAMVRTSGFTRESDPAKVRQAGTVTHYFSAHSPKDFFSHEARMFVGTIINRWLFEHLWSLRLHEPAGPLIRDWNSQRPQWTQEIIDRNIRGRKWLIPPEMLLGRFRNITTMGLWRFILRLPIAVAATLLTIPPAIMANKRLKLKGAASFW